MSSQGQVTFKAYLDRKNGEPEIRRFIIDADVVTNFTYFKQKLESLFPVLKMTSYSISWRDTEGDLIRISSDNELMDALTEMNVAEIKKIYINVAFGSSAEREEIPEEPLPSVVCDGCEEPITGFRYKCIMCPDYDNCANCENKKLHTEHIMIRFPPSTFLEPMHGKLRKVFAKLSRHCTKGNNESCRRGFRSRNESGCPRKNMQGGDDPFFIPGTKCPFPDNIPIQPLFQNLIDAASWFATNLQPPNPNSQQSSTSPQGTSSQPPQPQASTSGEAPQTQQKNVDHSMAQD